MRLLLLLFFGNLVTASLIRFCFKERLYTSEIGEEFRANATGGLFPFGKTTEEVLSTCTEGPNGNYTDMLRWSISNGMIDPVWRTWPLCLYWSDRLAFNWDHDNKCYQPEWGSEYCYSTQMSWSTEVGPVLDELRCPTWSPTSYPSISPTLKPTTQPPTPVPTLQCEEAETLSPAALDDFIFCVIKAGEPQPTVEACNSNNTDKLHFGIANNLYDTCEDGCVFGGLDFAFEYDLDERCYNLVLEEDTNPSSCWSSGLPGFIETRIRGICEECTEFNEANSQEFVDCTPPLLEDFTTEACDEDDTRHLRYAIANKLYGCTTSTNELLCVYGNRKIAWSWSPSQRCWEENLEPDELCWEDESTSSFFTSGTLETRLGQVCPFNPSMSPTPEPTPRPNFMPTFPRPTRTPTRQPSAAPTTSPTATLSLIVELAGWDFTQDQVANVSQALATVFNVPASSLEYVQSTVNSTSLLAEYDMAVLTSGGRTADEVTSGNLTDELTAALETELGTSNFTIQQFTATVDVPVEMSNGATVWKSLPVVLVGFLLFALAGYAVYYFSVPLPCGEPIPGERICCPCCFKNQPKTRRAKRLRADSVAVEDEGEALENPYLEDPRQDVEAGGYYVATDQPPGFEDQNREMVFDEPPAPAGYNVDEQVIDEQNYIASVQQFNSTQEQLKEQQNAAASNLAAPEDGAELPEEPAEAKGDGDDELFEPPAAAIVEQSSTRGVSMASVVIYQYDKEAEPSAPGEGSVPPPPAEEKTPQQSENEGKSAEVEEKPTAGDIVPIVTPSRGVEADDPPLQNEPPSGGAAPDPSEPAPPSDVSPEKVPERQLPMEEPLPVPEPQVISTALTPDYAMDSGMPSEADLAAMRRKYNEERRKNRKGKKRRKKGGKRKKRKEKS